MSQYLGLTGVDMITGFRGVITAHVKYLTGCDQVGVTPKINDKGEIGDTRYFDVNRIKIDEDAGIIVINTTDERGGPNRDAPSR